MKTDPPPSSQTLSIALAGNPNVGKTTLFNRLTGARQRVGNYPGVTVEKKTGSMNLGGETVTVIDLPGTYSLAAASADERVVIDVLSGHFKDTPQPDVVVCVVDATNLMRNAFLASQIADIGVPVVIALNMYDVAEQEGIAVDPDLLSQRLGVPVEGGMHTETAKHRNATVRLAITVNVAQTPKVRVHCKQDITCIRHDPSGDTGEFLVEAVRVDRRLVGHSVAICILE